jgi:hypothetical protein
MATEYPNDSMTRIVARALRSGRQMKHDADGWLVDAKTGELIGPDPAIEKPLTKAQLDKAAVRRGRPPKPDRKQTRPPPCDSIWTSSSTSVKAAPAGRPVSTTPCGGP